MDIITNLLETIYNEITLPIIRFVLNIPSFTIQFILFILVVALGYIIGRFVDFIARIVLSYLNLDNFFKSRGLDNSFFKIPPSIYIRRLLKYYIYLYFLILGLEKFGINPTILFSYLNIFYTIAIVISLGFVVSAILEKYMSNIFDKKILLNLVRGLTIYIFLIWALEIVNLPTTVFYTLLSIFLIVVAISLGLFVGIILALEYKEEIKKIITK